jgi:diphthamide biosynthesis protein 4
VNFKGPTFKQQGYPSKAKVLTLPIDRDIVAIADFNLSNQTLAEEVVDFYHTLSIPPTASFADVKAAYRRALLLHHPDKRPVSRSLHVEESLPSIVRSVSNSTPSVSDIRQAYTILSDPVLRAGFDSKLRQSTLTSSNSSRVEGSQRPAEVISLDDFESSENAQLYSYKCRCGSAYQISAIELEQDVHLMGCQGCSEVIWIGYEVAED